MVCIVPGSRSAVGAPPNTRIQLDQRSMATVTWSPPSGGHTDYLLWTIPLNGSPQGIVSLPAAATRAMHETAGVPTCYVLLVRSGASVTGNSDAVCAVPGQSDLAGTKLALAAGGSLDVVDTVLDRMRRP
jgi:hypothetical protein